MKIDITYDGGLGAAAEMIEQRLAEAIGAGAETVRTRAQSICPVDTGALRNSITVTQNGGSAEISANTDYAAFVEFGTSKMGAQPYLVPSLLGSENAVLSAVMAAITD